MKWKFATMPADKLIWGDFIKGEKYALSHIYYQNIQLLYRYGKKFSNDDELIKDTIQDLFFDLIRSRSSLGTTDNITFYLMASFRRKLVRNQKKHIKFDELTENSSLEAQIIYSAEHDLIDREELSKRDKIVQKALSELSPKQREIIFYRFTCDFNYEQICEIMSLKYDSARKQVFRALKTLKQYLPEKDILLFYFSYKKNTPSN